MSFPISQIGFLEPYFDPGCCVPEEVMRYIFTWLNMFDLATCERVSKLWHKIVLSSEQNLWQLHQEKFMPMRWGSFVPMEARRSPKEYLKKYFEDAELGSEGSLLRNTWSPDLRKLLLFRLPEIMWNPGFDKESMDPLFEIEHPVRTVRFNDGNSSSLFTYNLDTLSQYSYLTVIIPEANKRVVVQFEKKGERSRVLICSIERDNKGKNVFERSQRMSVSTPFTAFLESILAIYLVPLSRKWKTMV